MGDLEAVRAVPGGLELRVWVQPGASRTELVGRMGEALKIRGAAPTREGKAHGALPVFLAQLVHVPKTLGRG